MFRISLIAVCGLWLACAATMAAAPDRQVLRAQERLEALGLSPGPIDGVMGSQTRGALRAFQQRNGLAVTGELEWETRLALAATVRTTQGPSSAPVPQAVPVPAISIVPLAAPGTEPAGKDIGSQDEAPVVVVAEAEAPAVPAPPPMQDLLSDPGVASDAGRDPGRSGLVAGLSLIAAGAGIALLGWLRWWSKPITPARKPE